MFPKNAHADVDDGLPGNLVSIVNGKHRNNVKTITTVFVAMRDIL